MTLHARRRILAQPPRIEALNRKRRIMRDPAAPRLLLSSIDRLMLVVVVACLAALLVVGALRASSAEPCTARLTYHGARLTLPGVMVAGQCVLEVPR